MLLIGAEAAPTTPGMPSTNYTLVDTSRILIGFLLFAIFGLLPGYVAGSLTNVLMFRERLFRERILIATAVSAASSPLLIYLAGRAAGPIAIWTLFVIILAAGVFFITRDLRHETRPFAGTRWAAAAAVGWIVAVLVVMVDFHWNGHLYLGYTSFDLSVRTEFTDAIARTGVTPSNPFFYPGHAVPLRYHYFWFIPCAMLDVLSGGWVDPREAIVAASIWDGFSLFALLTLFVWRFRVGEAPPSCRRSWIAVGLLWVMGLDILPVLFFVCLGAVFFTPDAWNNEVAGWLHSVLSAQHHVAATVACLTGFIALWTSNGKPRSQRLGSIVVAAIAFACSVGLSIYVALVFGASMLTYMVIAALRKWRPDLIRITAAGVFATILALPYLLDLGATHGRGGGDHLISPAVREFYPVEYVLRKGFNVDWTTITIVNAVLLPVNYTFELGLFLLVAILQLQRYRRRKAPLGRKEWSEIVLITVPALICTFFRSSLVAGNDLGWRGFLIPQFFLVLWAVDYVRYGFRARKSFAHRESDGRRRIRLWIRASVWIGLAGTVYAVVMGRAYIPLVDAGLIKSAPNWIGSEPVVGRRTLALRQAYEWIGHHTPQSAVILLNPNTDHDLQYGLYAKRQGVAADYTCGTIFGGSAETCREMLAVIRPVFNDPTAADRIDLDSLCRTYSAGLIVVKDNDPSWRSPNSWVWRRHPVYFNEFSRVFTCSVPLARAGMR